MFRTSFNAATSEKYFRCSAVMLLSTILTCLLVVALAEDEVVPEDREGSAEMTHDEKLPLNQASAWEDMYQERLKELLATSQHVAERKSDEPASNEEPVKNEEPALTDESTATDQSAMAEKEMNKRMQYVINKILPPFYKAIEEFVAKAWLPADPDNTQKIHDDSAVDPTPMPENKLDPNDTTPVLPIRRTLGIFKKLSGKVGISASFNANFNHEVELSALKKVERETKAKLEAKKKQGKLAAQSKAKKLKYQAEIERLQKELDWLHEQIEIDEMGEEESEVVPEVSDVQLSAIEKEMMAKIQREYMIELQKHRQEISELKNQQQQQQQLNSHGNAASASQTIVQPIIITGAHNMNYHSSSQQQHEHFQMSSSSGTGSEIIQPKVENEMNAGSADQGSSQQISSDVGKVSEFVDQPVKVTGTLSAGASSSLSLQQQQQFADFKAKFCMS